MPSPIVRTLELVVTLKCNTACHFCYQKKTWVKNKFDYPMNNRVVRKALDLFFGNFPDKGPKARIVFIGGEPLFSFCLIKDTVKYLNKKFFAFEKELVLISSGSLIDRGIVNFIINNNIKLRLSLHNKRDTIRLRELFDYFVGYRNLGVSIVITEETLSCLAEIFSELLNAGYRRFYFIPEFIYWAWPGNSFARLALQLRKITGIYLQNIQKGIFIDYIDAGQTQIRYLSARNKDKNGDLCILKEIDNGNFVIMPNGDIFSCNIGNYAVNKESYSNNLIGNLGKPVSLQNSKEKIRKIYGLGAHSDPPCFNSAKKKIKTKLNEIFLKEQEYANNRLLGINSRSYYQRV